MIDLTEEQRLIQREIRDLCTEFDDEYWRQRDWNHEYPTEFVDMLADHGWMGTMIPTEYNGAGLDTLEAALILEEIAASGAGTSGSTAVHGAMWIPRVILNYGTNEMRERYLPAVARGEKSLQCFALTEPNSGYESTAITTTARETGDSYVINGQKVWVSRYEASDYMVLVARTTPRDAVQRDTLGISLFFLDIEKAEEQGAIEAQTIQKNIRSACPSYEVWFEDLELPAENLIGGEDRGFYHMLDSLNEERVVLAAQTLGLGRVALDRAVDYAIEREVFDRPIGSNQAIQHPLADAHTRIQSARLMTYHAAKRLKAGDDPGEMANIANYLAGKAAEQATDAAFQTHGGWGAAMEYDVERWWREARLGRITPASDEMLLNYVAEHVLDLPRSY